MNFRFRNIAFELNIYFQRNEFCCLINSVLLPINIELEDEIVARCNQYKHKTVLTLLHIIYLCSFLSLIYKNIKIILYVFQ